MHDVAEFVQEHPGGKAVIGSAIGKDATGMFSSHSKAALNLVSTMREVGGDLRRRAEESGVRTARQERKAIALDRQDRGEERRATHRDESALG